MKNNTNDNRNSVISSNEQYEEALKRLKYYKDEYKWITEAENPRDKIKEINDESLKILPMLNTERNREQRYYRKYYNTLIRKKHLIESGKYQGYLRKNMLSVFAAIMQYKIDSKNYSIISMAKGILQKDESLLEDIHNDKMLSRIRVWDGIPKEEDLALQSPEEILEYIEKHCNLVGIQIPKKSEDRTLLPAISDGYLSNEQKQLIEMLDKFINDDEITASTVSDSQIEVNEANTGAERNFDVEIKENSNRDEKQNMEEVTIEQRFRAKHGSVSGKDEREDDKGEIGK